MMASVSPSTTFRHCAYCLISISSEEVKLCGKCGRRAYCSKECQVKDWTNPAGSQGQRGQGHKNWCHLLCGEEDLDWKVTPVEGKGLGLIALKPYPKGTRILVDACQISPDAHPATKDLAPEGATLVDKWTLNSMNCDMRGNEDTVLCLRISRANHSCSPNAMHLYCNTCKVKLLCAERDIAPGEEICVTYQTFKSPSMGCKSLQLCPVILGRRFGITCPEDCACKDVKILANFVLAVELDNSIMHLASEGRVEEAIGGVNQLLTLHNGPLASSLLEKRRTLYDGFQIGIMTKDTLTQGREYMKQLVGIMENILHPKSKTMRDFLEFHNNPGLHRNYLVTLIAQLGQPGQGQARFGERLGTNI